MLQVGATGIDGWTDGQIDVMDLLCFLQRQTEVASYDAKCYGTTKCLVGIVFCRFIPFTFPTSTSGVLPGNW
jgi:hypothetical protein